MHGRRQRSGCPTLPTEHCVLTVLLIVLTLRTKPGSPLALEATAAPGRKKCRACPWTSLWQSQKHAQKTWHVSIIGGWNLPELTGVIRIFTPCIRSVHLIPPVFSDSTEQRCSSHRSSFPWLRENGVQSWIDGRIWAQQILKTEGGIYRRM